MPEDDDTNYTLIALKLMERCGRSFTSADMADTWLRDLPYFHLCTAERVGYRNLVNLHEPPESGSYRNSYREWIGAQIPWGSVRLYQSRPHGRGRRYGLAGRGDDPCQKRRLWGNDDSRHDCRCLYHHGYPLDHPQLAWRSSPAAAAWRPPWRKPWAG